MPGAPQLDDKKEDLQSIRRTTPYMIAAHALPYQVVASDAFAGKNISSVLRG